MTEKQRLLLFLPLLLLLFASCKRGPQSAEELGIAWGENDCKMKRLNDQALTQRLSDEEAKAAYNKMQHLRGMSGAYQKMYHTYPSEKGWSQTAVFNQRRATRSRQCGINF
jgi:hypothetical protein